jgi:uncharacterized protein YbjT (DUF2867 family)
MWVTTKVAVSRWRARFSSCARAAIASRKTPCRRTAKSRVSPARCGTSVEALTTGNYVGQSLPITGPQALTFAEATAAISAALERPLVYQPISDEEARQRYAATAHRLKM